ncbi:hypothetical protein AJ80_03468 [Polytolypa hystricis UAMH7299]|uniref:PhoD-like phosphatase domain-containing protein n=1 Tax=Polytolypa hystricis (strain UAMH7299) TaxID=1447883 RepID=A0A2B7YIN1_POLH7|nr:hypothetical protein AJ80_03468 [Polytolypa hystricis UAMH7299]
MAATSRRAPPPTQVDRMRDEEVPINGIARPALPIERRQTTKRNSRPSQIPPPFTLPEAPEAPRPPPGAHRHSYGGPSSRRGNGVRSFSERARELPVQQRVNGLEPLSPTDTMPWIESQRQINGAPPSSAPSRKSYLKAESQIPPQTAASKALPPLPPGAVSTNQAVEPDAPIRRSNTLHTPRRDSKVRDWAPERSPLQKLEVTLKDISKEEKRARVEEAEMLLREAKAGRRSRRISRDTAPSVPGDMAEQKANTEEPSNLEEAGLVRSLSSKQRDRLHQSALIESTRPEPKHLSKGERRGFDYVEQQGIQNPKRADESVSPEGPPSRYNSQASHEPRRHPHTRSVSESTAHHANQRPFSFVGDDSILTATPVQQQTRHVPQDSDSDPRPLPPTVTVQRGNSRKLQKPLPRDLNMQLRTNYRDEPRGIQGPLQGQDPAPMQPARDVGAHQPSSRTAPMPRKAAIKLGMPPGVPVGLGLTNALDSERHLTPPGQEQQPQPPHTNGNGTTKPRQTVSFAVPPPTPPPLEEWRSAVVGRLTAAEFNLRVTGGDKAWWEDGGSGRRRSKGVNIEAKQPPRVELKSNSAFSPPLYLQCGPLLRYTGMKRERIDRADGPMDREIWRGSIMIVTKDSASSYDIPPTLRIFSQPMDLLPPPPAELHGESDEQLAPEYVDPIAGATKIGRNGKLLYVKPIDHIEEAVDLSSIEDDEGLFEASPSPVDFGTKNQTPNLPEARIRGKGGEVLGKYKEIKGVRLYADTARDVTFWRFSIEIELGNKQERIAYRINNGSAVGFWVPAKGQTMNMMFHSGNGFGLSVDRDRFSGPDPLWRDVLNTHQTSPFHVMIGGGEQIHGDEALMQTDHFREWMGLKLPVEKRQHPFNIDIKSELETFYLEHYSKWFSQGLFSMANAQIPMVNMWNDHDIISRYGSYPHPFMKTPVFSGLGSIAFKYYMLFQHQSVPEETHADEPSWLLGSKPGPYIQEKSRNLFMRMGSRVAFLALDGRTERTRGDVLCDDSYDYIREHLLDEINSSETKHLIVLLGVPVAYPRLVWLESVSTSRIMDPVKTLGRAGLFTRLGIDTETLDDQWTAKSHKLERRLLIEDLQELAAKKSVRVTILSGDVHLAGIGQFYSNPKLQITKDRDYRYMPNVISSGIANAPTSETMADGLNRRNKVHVVDVNTVEDMRSIFAHDVDGKPRNNKRLLPRRNWCSIREYNPGATPPQTPSESPSPETPPEPSRPGKLMRSLSLSQRDGAAKLIRRFSLRGGAPPSRNFTVSGTDHHRMSYDGASSQAQDSYFPPQPHPPKSAGAVPAAPSSFSPNDPSEPRPGNFIRRRTDLSTKELKRVEKTGGLGEQHFINLEGGLDITLNCEVNPRDPAGITTPYRLLVPALWFDGEWEPFENETKNRWWKLKRKKGGATRVTNQADEDEDEDDEEEEDEEHNEDVQRGENENYGDDYDDEDDEEEEQVERLEKDGIGLGYSRVEAYRPKKKFFGMF